MSAKVYDFEAFRARREKKELSKQIANKIVQAVHQAADSPKGKRHLREAGRKGGLAAARKRKQREADHG